MSVIKPEDLEGIVGIDIVQQIESELVKELSDSINKQIIQNILIHFHQEIKKEETLLRRFLNFLNNCR